MSAGGRWDLTRRLKG